MFINNLCLETIRLTEFRSLLQESIKRAPRLELTKIKEIDEKKRVEGFFLYPSV